MTRSYLDAAFQIGIELVRDALWDGKRCNWFAPVHERFASAPELCGGILGPGFYDGTAGIALFLARLYEATGDGVVARAAGGAVEHALSRTMDLPRAIRGGFYTGEIGIGFAAIDAGTRLRRADFVARGLAHVRGALTSGDDQPGLFDVMSGLAGTIAPLLFLHAAHGEQGFLDAARAAGRRLVSAARREGETMSWDTTRGLMDSLADLSIAWLERDKDTGRHLTGLSHGSTGIALALEELATATDDDALRAVVKEAHAYEDATFDIARDRWVDLRCGEGEAGCDAAWCHGAVGIGLARARCFVLTGDPGDRVAAVRALRVTARDLARRLGQGENFSLCHGVAGDADLFLYAAAHLGETEGSAVAVAIAARGLRHHFATGRPWTSGIDTGLTHPSLMLGSAGTGHFYLRMHDPRRFGSVLMITPDEAATRPGALVAPAMTPLVA